MEKYKKKFVSTCYIQIFKNVAMVVSVAESAALIIIWAIGGKFMSGVNDIYQFNIRKKLTDLLWYDSHQIHFLHSLRPFKRF